MATATPAKAPLPSGIVSYEDYIAKNKVKAPSNTMDQGAFLTLFTTQLKNQNPLDPVKNEAFVAQLAQFSQLEATTAMKTSMEAMVQSLQGDKMLAGASMIGRKVAVPNGPLVLLGGQPIEATVDLPTGAEGVQMQIMDEKGQVVRKQIFGAQAVGAMKLTWDGMNDGGATMPDGTYTMQVLANAQGKAIQPVVNTLATVRSVSNAGTGDNTWLLEVDGGKSVSMAEVKRIAY
ncbi:MAG: Basal-body rod modification protein FlgD [Pseudomonadota bacterium]|jgi:flagellar basal-body rod modification protein FlgD